MFYVEHSIGSYGEYQGPTNINLRGPYFTGKVKARAWLSSDLPTASINMSVYMDSEYNMGFEYLMFMKVTLCSMVIKH